MERKLKALLEQKLTEADVGMLLANPSADVRVATARKVAIAFASGSLDATAEEISIDIFRAMLRDAEIRVRVALSKYLRTSRNLPRDIAMALARDVEMVSLPWLEHAESLSDEALIELAETLAPEHCRAIARRRHVSAPLAERLADHRDAGVVATLVENNGADLTDRACESVIERHGRADRMLDRMVHRDTLPIAIAERLVGLVSDQLRQHILLHHDVSEAVVSDLIQITRDHAISTLFPANADAGLDVERLVDQLHRRRQLTANLVFRALCLGDLPVFEAAMARLAEIPLINARLLIHDAGPLGLRAIYDHAGLPTPYYPLFRAAFDAVRNTDYDEGDRDRERLRERVIERVLTQSERVASDDLDYLLGKLHSVSAA